MNSPGQWVFVMAFSVPVFSKSTSASSAPMVSGGKPAGDGGLGVAVYQERIPDFRQFRGKGGGKAAFAYPAFHV
jgi:hypothetical protein